MVGNVGSTWVMVVWLVQCWLIEKLLVKCGVASFIGN